MNASLAHGKAGLLALRAHAELWLERRAQRRALFALGDSLARAGDPALKGHEEQLALLEAALATSLDRDRDDFAALPGWTRPLVVLRGLFDRALLRERRRKARAARAVACVAAALAALGCGAEGELADEARKAMACVAAMEADLRALLAPHGGRMLPRAAGKVAREVGHFARFLVRELRNQVPRLPALAGLGVGYWIASTFTDSEFSATLHALGFGSGPRRALRSETLHALSFWLPIVTAAICSYGGARLSALVHARYAPTSGPDGQRQLR